MKHYTLYENATGRIKWMIEIPDPSLIEDQDVPEGCSFVEGPSDSRTHYVVDGEIRERPVLTVLPDEADLDEEVTYDIGADFEIVWTPNSPEADDFVAKDGRSFTLKPTGAYEVEIEAWPYRPHRFRNLGHKAMQRDQEEATYRQAKMRAMEAVMVIQGFGDIADGIANEAEARQIVADFRLLKARRLGKPD